MLLAASPARADGAKSYFEIVREKPKCTGGECFIEYVVLSDGTVVRKQIDKAQEDAAATMSVGKVGDTGGLFAKAAALFKGAGSAASRSAGPDNVFFYDGEKFYSYGSTDPDAPAYLALFQDVKAAFAKAAPAPDFYAHVYYTPLTGNTRDFHVFSDGTVIASMFGKDTYIIIYTYVTATAADEIANLRKLGAEAVKSPSADYKKCAPASGIDYGFVEMKIDGGYIRSYTCGDGNDGVASLFRHVRAAFDGIRPAR